MKTDFVRLMKIASTLQIFLLTRGMEFIFFKTVSVDFKEKSQTLQFPLLHLPRFAEAGKETPVKPMERKK
jgi:hypothetical protein